MRVCNSDVNTEFKTMLVDETPMTGLPLQPYSESDHDVWRQLHARQSRLVRRHGSRAYLAGLDALGLPADHAADLNAINAQIQPWSAWRFIPVTSFLPSATFFRYLHERRFPIRTTMRRPDELDFAELPDLFHDLFGHGPHLFSPVLGPIIDEFARTAMRHADDEALLSRLSKLFWITFEVGIIHEAGEPRAYGAAILSSRGEMSHVFDRHAPTLPLAECDLTAMTYEPRALQHHYVQIDSYDQIIATLRHLCETSERARG